MQQQKKCIHYFDWKQLRYPIRFLFLPCDVTFSLILTGLFCFFLTVFFLSNSMISMTNIHMHSYVPSHHLDPFSSCFLEVSSPLLYGFLPYVLLCCHSFLFWVCSALLDHLLASLLVPRQTRTAVRSVSRQSAPNLDVFSCPLWRT